MERTIASRQREEKKQRENFCEEGGGATIQNLRRRETSRSGREAIQTYSSPTTVQSYSSRTIILLCSRRSYRLYSHTDLYRRSSVFRTVQDHTAVAIQLHWELCPSSRFFSVNFWVIWFCHSGHKSNFWFVKAPYLLNKNIISYYCTNFPILGFVRGFLPKKIVSFLLML